MKKLLITAACLVAAVVLYFLSRPDRTTPSPENPATPQTATDNVERPSGVHPGARGTNSTVATAAGSQSSSVGETPGQPQDLSARAGEYVPPAAVPVDKLSPEIAVQNVRRAVRQYGQMFGGNPVGTNPEITAALQGNNPKKINFLAAQDGMQVNGQGELVDAWGTPYFFHQISGTEMEVHSAGPDKQMWTSDDIVTK